MNTKNKIKTTFFFEKYKKEWKGVCYELGIVHYNKDLKQLMEDMYQMASDQLDVVLSDNMPLHNINRGETYKAYERMKKIWKGTKFSTFIRRWLGRRRTKNV